MGSAAWLRSAIGVASAATSALGLREDVTHRAPVLIDALGTVTEWGAPVLRSAMVQRQQGVLVAPGGQEVKYKAVVSFVGPVDVGVRDEIILWDGVTGPLYIPSGGMSDPTTGKPFIRLVYLRR